VGCGNTPEVEEPTVVEQVEVEEPLQEVGGPSVLRVSNGEATISTWLGRRKATHTVALHEGVVNVASLDTLEYTRGYVLGDVETWKSDSEERDQKVRDHFFSLVNEYTQTMFDIETVGTFEGELLEGGSVEAQVVGRLQVGSYVQEAFFDARFTRTGPADFKVETIEPVIFSLTDFRRTKQLSALAEACGIRGGFSDRIEISAHFELHDNADRQIPRFIRTPITVSTTHDIEADIAARFDDYADYQERMKTESGRTPMTRTQFRDIKKRVGQGGVIEKAKKEMANRGVEPERDPSAPLIVYFPVE
jgi:hypothetical protein